MVMGRRPISASKRARTSVLHPGSIAAHGAMSTPPLPRASPRGTTPMSRGRPDFPSAALALAARATSGSAPGQEPLSRRWAPEPASSPVCWPIPARRLPPSSQWRRMLRSPAARNYPRIAALRGYGSAACRCRTCIRGRRWSAPQSFHWFATPPNRWPRFAACSSAGGMLGLIWNVRDQSVELGRRNSRAIMSAIRRRSRRGTTRRMAASVSGAGIRITAGTRISATRTSDRPNR